MQKELLRAGAVVDYSKRSKSFYKNANKLNLKKFCKNFHL